MRNTMPSSVEVIKFSFGKSCVQTILLIGILSSCVLLVFILQRNQQSFTLVAEDQQDKILEDELPLIHSHSGKPRPQVPPPKHSKGHKHKAVHGKSPTPKAEDARIPTTTTRTPKKTELPKLNNNTNDKDLTQRIKYKFGQREIYLEGANRENYPVKTLRPGQVQDFRDLRAECKKSGKDFEDPEFNPNGSIDLIGNVDLLSGNDYPKWNGKFVWKRPKEINKNVIFSKLDAEGKRYKLSDIKQGSLGDCYYLSALGLVTTHEKLVNFIIPNDNNDEPTCGIYHFRFWIRGYYFDIVVDDRLPYIDTNGHGKLQLAFTEMSGPEMWTVLIEKAYAKIYGSYGLIEGGVVSEALEDMTGGFIETMLISQGNITTSINFMSGTLQSGFVGFTGFGTPEKGINGLISGHAYAFLSMETLMNKKDEVVKLVRMRNPWGSSEWTGDWSDESPMWNTVHPDYTAYLNIVKDEGEFWISADTIATDPKVFDRAYSCYWFNDLDEVSEGTTAVAKAIKWYDLHGTWKGKGTQDPKDWDALASQPQYLAELYNGRGYNKSVLLVSLMYKDYIHNKDSIPSMDTRVYRIKDESLLGKKPPFSANDFKTKKLERIHLLPTVRIAKAREYCTGDNLLVGTYVLIPTITKGKHGGDYYLRVIGEVNVTAPTN